MTDSFTEIRGGVEYKNIGSTLPDGGYVLVAFGYYTDEYLAVLAILPTSRRVGNKANYATFLVDLRTGKLEYETTFANIVEAVEDYVDNRGMGI